MSARNPFRLLAHVGEECAGAVQFLRPERAGDGGHFSLAGGQPKTGLFRDPETGRWGIPKRATPSAHLLKPATGPFDQTPPAEPEL